MRPDFRPAAGLILVLALAVIILAACAPPQTLSAQEMAMIASTQTLMPSFCEGCAQATLSALQTQEQISADAQAAAAAEIMRVNAQETLNAASSTLSAAQTQAQNSANIIAAQMAATAEIIRANAQATLNSAGANPERRPNPGRDPPDPGCGAGNQRRTIPTGSTEYECNCRQYPNSSGQ